MGNDSGKGFWDFADLHPIKSFVGFLLLVILIGFFVLNGYSVSKDGLTAPTINHDTTSAVKNSRDSLRQAPTVNIPGLSRVTNITWVNLFVSAVNILVLLLFTTMLFSLKKKLAYAANDNKRIQVFEYIFKEFAVIRRFDQSQSKELQEKLRQLAIYVNENGLYIDRPAVKLWSSINDYFLIVAQDYSNKDLKKEIEFAEKFKKIFN